MTEPSWAPVPGADRTIAESWLLSLRTRRFRSRRSGLEHDYYVIELADCVNVIAVTPEREVLFVRQFRAGSGAESLETPGGLLDRGEDPLEAAARELLEETGYAGGPPRLICTLWSNPSILTSRAATVLIEDVCPVADPRPDPGEELALERHPAEAIPGMLASGAFGHSLVAAGLLWWLAGSSGLVPVRSAAEG